MSSVPFGKASLTAHKAQVGEEWRDGSKYGAVPYHTQILRLKVNYSGYSKHLEMINSGVARIGAAKLWYSKPTKTYYLLVSMEVEVPELMPTDINRVMGVDVGQRYIAVAADTRNKTQFFSGKQVIHKASRYVKARKSLQRKGTRSATRRLVALSGRERRFIADTNHCIANQVVTPSTLIGLENLTHIRERTNPKRKGKKASKKQRRANSNKARWSFAELHGFIDYKAVLSRSLAVKVDAHYTSQACPCCGHTSKKNRPNKGLTFVCQQCGYTLHADLVGARNVALRVLLSRQDWESTGRFSAVPNASSDEGKADSEAVARQRASRMREVFGAALDDRCNLHPDFVPLR